VPEEATFAMRAAKAGRLGKPTGGARPPRLDVWLAERGHAESREKAQALVMAGRVLVNDVPARKPGAAVSASDQVRVVPGPTHVGRGGVKLEGALDAFAIDPKGLVCLDVGASTGGFTEILLRRGAARVYAVDTGRGQIHESLRADPRVVLRERTNARRLSTADVPEPCRLAVMDVSFISATKVVPALLRVLAPDADLIVLVKPQFEVGRAEVGRGGLVKDKALQARALREVAEAAQQDGGYGVRNACPSPLAGAEGNREFFLHLRRGAPALESAALKTLVERATC
jgi:23S rRNA (cytidine1920-2'-O)/16S rRNA (cytidine1409-2'-O)-methyltransferase